MSYSFDSDGWELFTTPFSSTSTRTAPASSTHHAERPQQKPPESSQHNTTPPAAQRNPLPSPKATQPARQTADTQQRPVAVQRPKPAPAIPVPNEKPAPAQNNTTKQEQAAPPKAPAPASTPPVAPQKELVLDMSSDSGAAPAPVQDDTERRKAHEAAEAKRKAEWEAKQAAKKQAEEAAIQKLNDMSDADAIEASIKRIGTETERLTRRNMKECVAEHIQELCRKDTEFARLTLQPRKNMVNCFRYINRKAKEFIQQEMKDNDTKPENGIYGCDIPSDIVLGWSEDYFNSTDAPEDKEKEETFTPKPYTGTPVKATKKTEKKPKKQQDKPSNGYEQISLEGVM